MSQRREANSSKTDEVRADAGEKPRMWEPGDGYPLAEVEVQVPSSWYRDAKTQADAYRVEADCAMRDYDWLESVARQALGEIAGKRPNKPFDSWAVEVARRALAEIDSGGKA